MPGRVLRSHGVVAAEGEEFMLNLLVKLTLEQVQDLVRLCDTRILQYTSKGTAKRAIYMAQQVFACAKDISRPPQYQVLEGKKERCKLCRISGKVKALQAETISNLEARAA
jgi:hypothetical protein